jgi:hypothetical protein
MRLGGECHFWKHIVGQIYRNDHNLVIVAQVKRELTTTLQKASPWE